MEQHITSVDLSTEKVKEQNTAFVDQPREQVTEQQITSVDQINATPMDIAEPCTLNTRLNGKY